MWVRKIKVKNAFYFLYILTPRIQISSWKLFPPFKGYSYPSDISTDQLVPKEINKKKKQTLVEFEIIYSKLYKLVLVLLPNFGIGK